MQALRTVFFSGPQDRSLKAQMSQTVETCKRKQHFQSIQLKKIRSPSIKLRELTTDSCEIYGLCPSRFSPSFQLLVNQEVVKMLTICLILDTKWL